MTNPARGALGLALPIVALALALALSGCGSTQSAGPGTPSTPASTTGPTSPAGSTSPSPPTSSATSATSAAPARPARCATSDLRISLGPGEGAAGSTYLPLRIENTSGHPCRTGGFGGVSFVGGDGKQLGAAADRVQRNDAKPLTLQPGGHAEATLRETNVENYSAAKCRPAPASRLRVYPPNETRSLLVAHPTTACTADRVHQLTLTPYQLVA